MRRIGIGKNGWSQVIYKNQLFFINSRYLSADPDFYIPLEWFLEHAEKDKNEEGVDGANDNTTENPETQDVAPDMSP